MKPREREAWIRQYLFDNAGYVDVLNTDFVMAYWGACGVKAAAQFYGAPRCPTLGRDLSRMYASGALDRSRVGLTGMESGFPKWVWTYRLTAAWRRTMESLQPTPINTGALKRSFS